MTASAYKHEWTLELPKLDTVHFQHRNLCVQIQRSSCGNYRAELIDLEAFRGTGSVQGIAIDALANELEHVAAEIRRESGKEMPDLEWTRAVYAAALEWRRHVNLVPATRHTQALIATIDAAIADERTAR